MLESPTLLSLADDITRFFGVKRKPFGLLEQPSVLDQTDWETGIYKFPNQPSNVEYFNCGIAHYQNVTWLVTRKRVVNMGRAGHNRIAFWELVNNRPTVEREVHFYKTYMDEHHEDPRVIVAGKKLLLSYCNFRHTSFAHQCLAEVQRDFRVPIPLHIPFGRNARNLMKNTGHEKNWLWFLHDGELHMVYTTDPQHVVCKIGAKEVIQVYRNQKVNHRWRFGEMRGGCPPVRVGNEYFSFFHSSLPWKNHKRRYFMGFYAFEAKPPFRITRVSYNAILAGSELDRRNLGAPVVVFPSGSLFDGKDWFVTYGINDCQCGWIKIPHEDLLRDMIKV